MAHRIAIYALGPISFLGGGELIAVGLANYLFERGHDVVLRSRLTSSDLTRTTSTSPSRTILAPHDVVTYNFRGWQLPGVLNAPSLPDVEQLSASKINLLFVNRLPSAKYLDLVSARGITLALLMHGIALEDYQPPNILATGYQSFLRLDLMLIARAIRRGKIHFQVLNECQRDALTRSGVPPNRVSLIENGIDHSHLAPTPNNEEFRAIFLGRFSDVSKGLRLLYLTARELKKRGSRAVLDVCGWGPDIAIAKRAARALPGSAVWEAVADDQKNALLSAANLQIVTSNMDPYPLSVIEGLSSGLPVVTTPSAGPRTIVSKDPSFGRVLPANPRALADATIKYYDEWASHPDEYFRARVLRAKLARQTFPIERMFSQYEALISALDSATSD